MIGKPCLCIHSQFNEILYLGYCQIHGIHIAVCTAVFTQKRAYHSNCVRKDVTVFLVWTVRKRSPVVRFMVKKIFSHGIGGLFIFFLARNLVQVNQGKTAESVVKVIHFTAPSYPSVIILFKAVHNHPCFL